MPLYRLVPLLLLLTGCSFIQPYDRESAESAQTEAAGTPAEEPAATAEAPAEEQPAPQAEQETAPAPSEEAAAPQEAAPAAAAAPEAAQPAAPETTQPAAPPVAAPETTQPATPPAAAAPAQPAPPATEAPRGTLAITPAPTPRANVVLPERGMSMKEVETKFGAPDKKLNAVGKPPITRWIYRDYTVYFEHTEVLEAVPNTP